MKFSLSDSTLRKILIGTVVAIIVLFVVAKIIQKSFYVYPNTKEEQGPIDITAMTVGTTTTFTTASAHGFAAGEIVLVKPKGTASSGVTFTLSGSAKAFANEIDQVTGGYVFVVETVTATTFTVTVQSAGTYTANSLSVEAAGKGVMTTLKSGLNDCQIAHFNSTASDKDATLATCIQGKVSTYVTGHCKYLPSGGGVLTAPTTTDVYALSLYTAYLANLTTVKNAYAQAFVNVTNKNFGAGVSGVTLAAMNAGTTTPASVIVNAAYAADVFHVLRKYIASVCPGFYAPSLSTVTDPTPLYLTWAAGAALAGNVRFTASLITDTNILTWAQYAVSNPSTAPDTVTVTPLITATIASTPFTDKSGLGGTNAQNWRKAMYAGPGTTPVSAFT